MVYTAQFTSRMSFGFVSIYSPKIHLSRIDYSHRYKMFPNENGQFECSTISSSELTCQSSLLDSKEHERYMVYLVCISKIDVIRFPQQCKQRKRIDLLLTLASSRKVNFTLCFFQNSRQVPIYRILIVICMFSLGHVPTSYN